MPISVLGALSTLFGSTYAADKQNQAIDKQIEAQRDENDKTRQYNLNLAKMQNQWNIDQYNRENSYNAPAAQMQRFKAAGLNPNLMYGQVNNTPVSIAGSLSSGAPATPTDMSALGGKRSGLASMFSSLGNSLMQIPIYREQVRGMKLDNDAKAFELGFKEFIHQNQFDPLGIKNALKGNLTPAQRKYLQDLQNDITQGDNLLADLDKKELDNALSSKTFNDQIDKIASEAKITRENAEYLAKSAVYRLNSDKYQSELYQLQKEYQANQNKWMDWDRWINHGINATHAVGDILALKNIVGMFTKKGGVLDSNGKGYWKKTGENTWEWTGN